jgi:hypothetical protein
MSARFLAGAGTWLLGAGVATCGSLLAVSALGQSLAPAPSQQLTMADVNQALASATAKPAHPAAWMSPVSSSDPQPRTANLASPGGSVVVECQPEGAYLVSSAPAHGYRAFWEARGPTATAKATFTSSRKAVTVGVSCSGRVPSKSIMIRHVDGNRWP